MNRLDRLCALLASVQPPKLAPGEREWIERGRYADIEALTAAVEADHGAAKEAVCSSQG